MTLGRRYRVGAMALVAVAATILTTGCGGKSVTVAGDQVGCVYSSANSGHKFKRSIEPGQKVNIGKTDELVRIPMGDQIYNITTTSNQRRWRRTQVLAVHEGPDGRVGRGSAEVQVQHRRRQGVPVVLEVRAPDVVVRRSRIRGEHGDRAAADGMVPLPRRGARRHDEQVVHDGSSCMDMAAARLRIRSDGEGAQDERAGERDLRKVHRRDVHEVPRVEPRQQLLLRGPARADGPGATPGCPPMYFQILSVYPRDKALSRRARAAQAARRGAGATASGGKLKAQNRRPRSSRRTRRGR